MDFLVCSSRFSANRSMKRCFSQKKISESVDDFPILAPDPCSITILTGPPSSAVTTEGKNPPAGNGKLPIWSFAEGKKSWEKMGRKVMGSSEAMPEMEPWTSWTSSMTGRESIEKSRCEKSTGHHEVRLGLFQVTIKIKALKYCIHQRFFRFTPPTWC